MYLLEDGLFRHAADIGASAELVAFNRAHPIAPTRAIPLMTANVQSNSISSAYEKCVRRSSKTSSGTL